MTELRVGAAVDVADEEVPEAADDALVEEYNPLEDRVVELPCELDLTSDDFRGLLTAAMAKRPLSLDLYKGAALYDPCRQTAVLKELQQIATRSPKDGIRPEEMAMAEAVSLMLPFWAGTQEADSIPKRLAHPLADWLRLSLGQPQPLPAARYWAENTISAVHHRAALLTLAVPVSTAAVERMFSSARDVLGVRAAGTGDQALSAALVLRSALQREPGLQLTWAEDRRRPRPASESDEESGSEESAAAGAAPAAAAAAAAPASAAPPSRRTPGRPKRSACPRGQLRLPEPPGGK